jgi:hypothetical protein
MEASHQFPVENMPAPACTPDGRCRECGEPNGHKGTCAWSLMRSGVVWVPQAWGKS